MLHLNSQKNKSLLEPGRLLVSTSACALIDLVITAATKLADAA